jgi:spore coat protein U-like protein
MAIAGARPSYGPIYWTCRFAVYLICSGWLLAMTTTPSQAVFCSLGSAAVAYGNISTTNGQNYNLAATYSVSCSSGSANESMIACLYNWGSANGGGGTSGPWYMKNGSNILNYNIYSNPGYSVALPQGSFVYSTFMLGGSGAGSTSMTLYFQVPSGQPTILPGNFSNTTNVLLKLGDLATLTTSCNGGATTQQINGTSSVTATVQGSCTVTGGAMNFGSTSMLSANVDASTTITPNCTLGTSYTVSLDGGQNGGTNASNRKMINGSQTVTYGLYSDSARTLGWYGASVSGTGNGSNQAVTVYGRVPPQTTPAPATYTDTVVITVAF